MSSGRRKTWIFAGVASLVLIGAVLILRGPGHADADQLAVGTRVALRESNWDLAETLLKRLSQQRAPTPGDRVLRAEMELGRGRLDASIALLTEIPETDPLAGKARLVAGQIEKRRARARHAEALFLQAARLDPKLGPAHRELMLLYATQARRLDVNEQFRALAELESLGFDDVFLWTTSFEDLWVNDVIRPALERFVAADPEDRISRLALAGVFIRSLHYDDAEKVLDALPDSDPEGLVLKARIALGHMRLDEVRSLLDRAPADHVRVALLRGQLAVRTNDQAMAARQFRIALQKDPTNHEALQALASVLKQLKDPEAASVQKQVERWHQLTLLMQRMRTLDSRNDKALLSQIGAVCESLGQKPVARAWYRLALAQDPLDGAIQQALFRVRDQSASGRTERD
jgi:tetratricopeptide (TPR) repeat protein